MRGGGGGGLLNGQNPLSMTKVISYLLTVPYTISTIDLSVIKLLTRLRLGWSHLNEHKFNHNFDDCVNPFCTCS